MARRYTDKEARKIMREAGFRPLVPYTSSSAKWPSVCMKCRKEVSPTFNNVNSKGARCTYCAGNSVHISDALSLIKKSKLKPLEDFPGAKKPWKLQCLTCKNTVNPTFSSIKQGGGCKYCARKEVGQLNKITNKEAVALMKSAGLKPLVAYPGGGKPWKSECITCKKIVSPRYSSVKLNKSGCKYCAGRAIDEAEAVILMQQNDLEPLESFQGNKHPWRAIHIPCGREVSPRYNGLKKGQGPCKYCAQVALDPKDAEAVFLAHDLRPLVTYPGNNRKPWKAIHIPCGNTVFPTFNVIQRNESIGCRQCSNQFVDPDEAFDYFVSKGFQPLVPYPGTNKPWKSIHLECGEPVQPRYGHIKSGRKGCPTCSGVVPISQERAFSFFRLNGLEPQEPFKGPHHPWKSIHKECGRKVSPRWASIQQGNNGCVYCSGKKVDLKDALLLLKKLELKPLEPFPGSSNPWKCIHLKCGNQVAPAYSALRSGQGPCIACGKNMVSRAEALELLAKNSYTPLTEFPGGSKPWECIHEICGSRVSITATYLRSGGKGCSYCAGTKPIAPKEALKLFRVRGYKPLEPFRNARTPIRAIHRVCGKEVKISWSFVRVGGNCRYCVGWRNLLAPAYVYLMTSRELNAHKIGVSGVDVSDNRIERHIKNGWEEFAVLNVETGEIAYEIEARVLDWLRLDMQLPPYLIPELMPQGGYSETVDSSEIELNAIWAKVEELSKIVK